MFQEERVGLDFPKVEDPCEWLREFKAPEKSDRLFDLEYDDEPHKNETII